MNKVTTLFAVVVLSWALAGAARPEETPPMSPEDFEKVVKAAAEKSVKSRKELYQKHLPKPKDLGQGWLLPWELPKAMRQVESEDEYWQTIAGAIDKGDKTFFGGMVSALIELSPEELGRLMDLFVKAAKEMPKEEVPAGLNAEQMVFGAISLVVNWELSPSLAKKMQQVFGFLEETQKVMAEAVARTQLGLQAIEGGKSQSEIMTEIVTKPLQGKTGLQIRQEILQWAATVRRTTAMTYTTCDNWDALLSAKEEDLKKIHLRHVVVGLTILDRNKMAGFIDDMKPEQAKALQQQFNQRLGDFRLFSFEVMRKKRTDELQKQIEEATNPERRSDLQEELAKLPEVMAKMQEAFPAVEVEVYTRNFGDNCYVIHMKGNINMPEFTMAATNLQSSLRNGNAIVFVGLGGNYPPEKLKGELDLFLSNMDAKTAFFRN